MSGPPVSLEDGDLYAARRARVLEALGENAAMLLPAAPELRAGRDRELPYLVDPELHYLTGYPDPGAAALLAPGAEDGPFLLFTRPRDPEAELWTGERGGPEADGARYGADSAFPDSELNEHLRTILSRVETLYYRLGAGREDVDGLVLSALASARGRRQRKGRGVRAIVDPGAILDDHRIIKSPREIELLREAAAITAASFREAAGVIRPGGGEWEVEAALEAGFRRRGASGPAFESIVASGVRSTVLHYVANSGRLGEGDLLLIDAGARLGTYNADVSRTFPVSGRFTSPQRALYEIVETARERAIAAIQPGNTEAGVHRTAVRALLEGLTGLGLLDGEPDALLEEEDAWKSFYPHRTCHWLGLEVHDVGDYAVDDEPRSLEVGMALTVEPGLYIPADREDVPPEFRGIGIRIEDDVVVTESGAECLTSGLPTDPGEVAAMVGGGRHDT